MLGDKNLKFLDKRLTAKRTGVKKPEDKAPGCFRPAARPRYRIA
jgi:hypothetical protein